VAISSMADFGCIKLLFDEKLSINMWSQIKKLGKRIKDFGQ